MMFGRAASYRFVDVPSDGRYNLALSQSQLDSAYLYEKWVKLLPLLMCSLVAFLCFSLLHHHTFRWMRDWSGKVFFIIFLFRKINFHRFFSFSHYFIWNLIRSLIGSLCCVIMCIWWLFFTWPRRNSSLEDHRTHITHTIGVGNEE